MIFHIKIVGTFLILLSLLHVVMPRYFNWTQELSGLSLISKQIMYVHTFFIAFIVLLMGLLCLYSGTELASSTLGKHLSLGLFIFWFTRLLFQFFVYSPRVWRGKKLETFVHIVFSILWSYFSYVFFLVYWQQV
ncbi:hypothetical protein ACFQ21_12125 [Ohtaekwangia kribbensis]|jgi:hypothetical protein|uniref:Uncharacterized protein n=1 Tax=Ohtaekwangia kribbensis TaxID=688913 RepID=A0ABW3K1F4_9BACT